MTAAGGPPSGARSEIEMQPSQVLIRSSVPDWSVTEKR